RLYSGSVVAVEEIGATGKRLEVARFETVNDDKHRSPVRILFSMSEPDRLHSRRAIASRTVRQETRLVISPHRLVAMFYSVGRGCPDDEPVALGPCPLEQLWHGAFERGRAQVVEAYLGQARSLQACS